MRLCVVKVDEYQFLTCLQHQLWGSKSARFSEWRPGDCLAFIVDKGLAALAEVAGSSFFSNDVVWDNGLYPHRIGVNFVHVVLPENRVPVLGEVRDALTSAWGPYYGLGIQAQRPLLDEPAQVVANAIRHCPNHVEDIQRDIDSFLRRAKETRGLRAKPMRRPLARSASRPDSVARTVEKPSVVERDDSLHSTAQRALVELGETAGCSIWIAANDRSRLYSGQALGYGCLKVLPNLGLSKDATTRISLIDVIWLRNNAPVCAFEVEATTSVYSGLLRMSDLLAVVPALNIKLFVVAPKERRAKVMGELGRPTFQKIGLSEYCRFISTEDLQSLVDRVRGLKGHIQPSILDTVAAELEDSIDGGLL